IYATTPIFPVKGRPDPMSGGFVFLRNMQLMELGGAARALAGSAIIRIVPVLSGLCARLFPIQF
ncbi:hypothetical protein, partial [Ralstonia solanacearum]|uniref:hypothetical protein n=1 Tax=Ralstonia solanacearum TaxID=305 RepID=UPI001E5828C8